MKKSAVIFVMLLAAALSVSCEGNEMLLKELSAAKDSAALDSASIARSDTLFGDTIVSIPGDTVIDIPQDTITFPPKDSIDHHPTNVELAGDEFTFTPSLPDSLSGDGITIEMIGTKTYPCLNSQLQYTPFEYFEESNTFAMSLLSVLQPPTKQCLDGGKQMSGRLLIYPVKQGSTQLIVKFNGQIYKGLLVRTGTTYNIQWPYDKGVNFSKFTLTR